MHQLETGPLVVRSTAFAGKVLWRIETDLFGNSWHRQSAGGRWMAEIPGRWRRRLCGECM